MPDMRRTLARVAELTAKDLRTFGYPQTTEQMIKDVWWAMKRGDKEMPHDVIGAFAQRNIQECLDAGLIVTDDAEPVKPALSAGTDTGRISSKEPNYNNVPRGHSVTPDGKLVKKPAETIADNQPMTPAAKKEHKKLLKKAKKLMKKKA